MKKLLPLLLALCLFLALSACSEPSAPQETVTKYKVTVMDAERYPIDPPLLESYAEGDAVTLRLKNSPNHTFVFYLNGERQSLPAYGTEYVEFTFLMPAKDVTISIENLWWEPVTSGEEPIGSTEEPSGTTEEPSGTTEDPVFG